MDNMKRLMAMSYSYEHSDFLQELLDDLKKFEPADKYDFYTINWSKYKDSADAADKLIFSIIAMEYGDYGCTPRRGWIKDIKGAIEFIEFILSF